MDRVAPFFLTHSVVCLLILFYAGYLSASHTVEQLVTVSDPVDNTTDVLPMDTATTTAISNATSYQLLEPSLSYNIGV